jgi:hypothetical protein
MGIEGRSSAVLRNSTHRTQIILPEHALVLRRCPVALQDLAGPPVIWRGQRRSADALAAFAQYRRRAER